MWVCKRGLGPSLVPGWFRLVPASFSLLFIAQALVPLAIASLKRIQGQTLPSLIRLGRVLSLDFEINVYWSGVSWEVNLKFQPRRAI